MTTTTNPPELNDFKENFKQKGEQLVNDVFPRRVMELHALINSPDFVNAASVGGAAGVDLNIPVPAVPPAVALPTADGGAKAAKKLRLAAGEAADAFKPDAKGDAGAGVPVVAAKATNGLVYAFAGGTAPCNHHVKALAEAVKPFITQLMDEAQVVRLWIQFSIPKIEDGNNFGVQVQEEALGEAAQIERDACAFLDQISRYYLSRGKLITRVAKYPHVEDYRVCVRDMDTKQAITMRYVLQEIRNHYAVLQDLIVKNLDRIKKPRSNNTINMY